MTRVAVDRDIKPIEHIRTELPEEWELEIGLPGEEMQLIEALEGVNVLLVTSRIPVTREVLAAHPRLEIVGKLGTGVDNIDLDATRDRGVPVVYTPGYNALSVAELGMGLLIATARRFTEARTTVEEGGWRDTVSLGTRVAGSTVGIVGFGNVGKRFARLLTGFGVDIRFYDPYVPPIDGELVGAEPAGFDELLESSDFVCLMPELTDETRGMVGPRELELMGSHAILVNTSRGAVVKQEALVDALRDDRIAGAGLDVFAEEPLPSDSPLLDLDNVVLTPHLGPATRTDRQKSIVRLCDNVHSLALGEEVPEEFLATVQ